MKALSRKCAMPAFATIVPAAAGFYVLDVLSDERGYPVNAIKYPVVAWALEEEFLAPFPVTMEGVQTDNAYILQPDGTIERSQIDGYADIDEWLKALQSDWMEHKGGR